MLVTIRSWYLSLLESLVDFRFASSSKFKILCISFHRDCPILYTFLFQGHSVNDSDFVFLCLQIKKELHSLKQINGPDPNYHDICFSGAGKYVYSEIKD